DSPKQCVVGMVERSTPERVGKVIVLTTENAQRATLLGIAKERILPESTVFTDEFVSYEGFGNAGYTHKRINHSEKVYVSGDIHTQTIDGFWSLVKNGLRGVYHSVGKKYLQSYLDEYSFRYNRRDRGNLIFNDVLQRISEQAS